MTRTRAPWCGECWQEYGEQITMVFHEATEDETAFWECPECGAESEPIDTIQLQVPKPD